MADEITETGQTNTGTSEVDGQAGVAATETAVTKGQETGTEGTTGEGSSKTQETEEGKEPEGAPEGDYEFTMPEGMEIDSVLSENISPILKGLNLPQAEVNKLTEAYVKVEALKAEQAVDAFEKQLDDWATEAKNDKEIGGAKFKETAANSRHVINTFGTPELKKMFEDTGLGNHPELIRVFSKIAPLIKEDSSVGGGGPAGGDGDIASRMYPNEAKSG